mmetsp:Transcript_2330/g.3178  ORF Transcript_2330/g.3178 Transcript_2330/m.3178 type:complete len:103 (+) Transcript_2330:84-392(+)
MNSIRLIANTMKTLLFCSYIYLLMMQNFFVASQTFDIFKSYKDARVRPASYSKNRRQHALREYLDTTQLQMMKKRMGPTSPDDTFTDKWSGIDKKIETEASK